MLRFLISRIKRFSLDGAKTDWIKPGRATFTWYVQGSEKLSVATQKRFVDGCAELGIESVVVDDGWELWQQTEKKRQTDGLNGKY